MTTIIPNCAECKVPEHSRLYARWLKEIGDICRENDIFPEPGKFVEAVRKLASKIPHSDDEADDSQGEDSGEESLHCDFCCWAGDCDREQAAGKGYCRQFALEEK